jgi:hypothetical protein
MNPSESAPIPKRGDRLGRLKRAGRLVLNRSEVRWYELRSITT